MRRDPDPDPAAGRMRHPRQEQAHAAGLDLRQPVGMVAQDRRFEHRARAACAERRDRRIAQHLDRRPLAQHAPVLERDHRGCEPRHFRRRVADIEHRHRHLVAQALEIGQDFRLARLVQRSQRLVGEDEPGAREQGAADGDPLLLAARQRAGAAAQQMPDAEHFDDAPHVIARAALRREPAPVKQVLAHGQMRKEPPFLEDVAEPAAVGRQPRAALRVEQHPAVRDRPPGLRPQQPRNGVDGRGLAGAGAAEQNGHARRRLEGNVELEAGEGMADGDGERHAPATRLATRRATSSESSSAAMETTMAMTTRRSADVSPPGTWRKV